MNSATLTPRQRAVENSKVLILEDNPADARLMQELLSESQDPVFSLVKAGTLREALELLAREEFDLILTDLNLPDETGLRTFYRVQSAAPATPILVMTGMNDLDAGARAVTSGAQDYLVKGPAESGRLLQSVRYALQRHRVLQDLKDQVRTDPLTRLDNRRGLDEILDKERQAPLPGSRPAMQVLLVDVDDFKRVNDLLGHDMGDVVLKEVADRLKAALRATDYAARVGGDEFLLILPRTTAGEAGEVASRVRTRVSDQPVALPSGPLKVTVSIGGVTAPPQAVDVEELLARTHHSLYKSKHEGKDRVSMEFDLPESKREEGGAE